MLRSMLVYLFLTVTVTAWAQNGEWRIDSGYSTASLSLASSRGRSWNVAIAKVSGTATFNDDPDKDALNLYIYPAREGKRLLDPKGGFRDNSYADLSRYALMSFHSSSFARTGDGKLAVTGELSVTHVQREPNISWSNAYSGPDYGQPMGQTTTRTVTFVFAAQTFDAQHVNARNQAIVATMPPKEISAQATIDLHNFAALRVAWLDSVWPLVVEDEHCEMPWARASFKDYSGAICTGNPVLPTPLSQPRQRFGRDYPGSDEVTAPDSDEATVLVDLRLEGH